MIGSVEFLDLRIRPRALKQEIVTAVRRVLERGLFIRGPENDAFEQEWSSFVGSDYCVGCGSGLDAIRMALTASGVGGGDEVIVPSNTFIATWMAVTHCGAIPVPVDPDPATFTITADAIESAIGPRTAAIVPVHLYGHPADMRPIRALAARRKLAIVEDAAQAHGARYRGDRIGHVGTVAWSFYPGKNLGAFGDAGAVTTDDARVADGVRRLSNYGSTEKYIHPEVGLNSRLDEIQAAVLRVKLPHLEEWNSQRRHTAAQYGEALATTSLELPTTAPWGEHVFHLYVIRSHHRDTLRFRLAEQGVGTLIHYPVPPHLQEAYKSLGIPSGSLPVAESMHKTVLSLPIGPHLRSSAARRVIGAVRSAIDGG